MKRLLWLLPACAVLGGCFSLQEEKPLAVPAPRLSAAQAAAGQKAQQLKEKKDKAKEFPTVLGGVVFSDRWVVYTAKEEEEFEGNVHYDNGTYAFRSDYALSQRKKNLFTARGHVFARTTDENGTLYTLQADRARYNYATGQGQASAQGKNPITLTYQTAAGDRVTARAQKAEFDTRQKIYILSGAAFITYQNAAGEESTLQADRITARQQDPYALLEGNAEVKNADYTLQADTLEYDGKNQMAYAYGQRPLAQGKTEDGTFAIIADKVTAQTATRQIKLSGRVQGWAVSDKLNRSKTN